MDAREMFLKSARHLLAQGARAENAVGSCRYRGQFGRQCAVGCLIDDKFYAASLEGIEARGALVWVALERSIGREIYATEMQMLSSLQFIHDTHPVAEWDEWLRELYRKTFNPNLTLWEWGVLVRPDQPIQ